MPAAQVLIQIAGIGVGATAVMDLWVWLLSRVGAASLNFDLVGRWIGHLFRGQLTHKAIRESRRIPGERMWGWLTHYAVGLAFAGVLVAMQGREWIQHPSLLPALAVGVCTVVAPLFIMQPAMGSGFASANTSTPFRNCLRSLANHAVFGLGLFLSARVLTALS